MKLIASTLLVCLFGLSGLTSTSSIASSFHTADAPYAGSEQLAAELSKELTLDLSQLIFQGEIFSQPMSAWQFYSEYGFGAFIKALPEQQIIQQYHGIGNLIMLSGDDGQHNVLMHVERTGHDAYRGFLSVMPSQGGSFSSDEVEQFQQYLLKQQVTSANSSVSWMPQSTTLLMDIKSTPSQSQRIYLDLSELDVLQQEVESNLTRLDWQRSITEDLGLSIWTKGSQQVRLYFSQQAEGTALYVLTQDSTKDVYESTHE